MVNFLLQVLKALPQEHSLLPEWKEGIVWLKNKERKGIKKDKGKERIKKPLESPCCLVREEKDLQIHLLYLVHKI